MNHLIGTVWRGLKQPNHLLLVVGADGDGDGFTTRVTILALIHTGQTMSVSLGGLQTWFEEWTP